MTKICIFGCKDTTRFLLQRLMSISQIDGLVTLGPDRGAQQQVAGYDDLSDFNEILPTIHIAKQYNLKTDFDQAFFDQNNFDVGFVVGWQRLIPESILKTFRVGAFGMHGSSQNLPHGRGRSPMNWSLIEGRSWFHTNLFQYMIGVDDGPIVGTTCFSVNEQDTAETLHFKNLLSMVSIIERNLQSLAEGSATLHAQNDGVPTYYPKREPSDGIVDWDSDIFVIERFVRAVTRPFDGAFSFVDETKVTFFRVAIFYTDLEGHPYKAANSGEICEIFPNQKFLIRCNGGVLLVHEFDSPDVTVLKKGSRFVSLEEQIRVFPRNRFGYFDIA